MDREEIERRFSYHPPDQDTRNLHEWLRAREREMAEDVADAGLGESREMSLFWTSYEQAVFWLHAHIARNMHRKP